MKQHVQVHASTPSGPRSFRSFRSTDTFDSAGRKNRPETQDEATTQGVGGAGARCDARRSWSFFTRSIRTSRWTSRTGKGGGRRPTPSEWCEEDGIGPGVPRGWISIQFSNEMPQQIYSNKLFMAIRYIFCKGNIVVIELCKHRENKHPLTMIHF